MEGFPGGKIWWFVMLRISSCDFNWLGYCVSQLVGS